MTTRKYEFWAVLKDGSEILDQNLTLAEASDKAVKFVEENRNRFIFAGSYVMGELTDKSHAYMKNQYKEYIV